MFEKFTDRSRKIMAFANQEAQRFNHDYIGTEHILLGMVKEGSGIAASVLKGMQIDIRKVRLKVEALVKAGPEMVTMGKLPQTPGTKRVLESAIEKSRALGNNYIGSEHILLGLVEEQTGIAWQVLQGFGLNTRKVRAEIFDLMGMETTPAEVGMETTPAEVGMETTPAEVVMMPGIVEGMFARAISNIEPGDLVKINMDKPSWHEYFMMEACVVAARSPDNNTKHGSIIVDEEHLPMGQGYNGFPRGGKVDYPTTRPEKYTYIIHSERNAILNCTRRPKGCTLYVTGKPCSGCMKDIIQSGIARVIYGQVDSAMINEDDWKISMHMAKNHGVELLEYKGPSPVQGLVQLCSYLKTKGWG